MAQEYYSFMMNRFFETLFIQLMAKGHIPRCLHLDNHRRLESHLGLPLQLLLGRGDLHVQLHHGASPAQQHAPGDLQPNNVV